MMIDILRNFPLVSFAVGWLVSLVGLYVAVRLDIGGLKAAVAQIVERNASADRAQHDMEAKIDARLTVAETRIDGHDVSLGRVDERWAHMQKSLDKIEAAIERLAAKH